MWTVAFAFIKGVSWQVWAGVALVAALGFTHLRAYEHGKATVKKEWNASIVALAAEAKVKTDALAESASLLRKARDAENARNLAQLNADLVGLRNRPERLPEPARAACQGSTGRELSQSDAGFLTRLASEADDLRAALDQCQAWAEQVRKP